MREESKLIKSIIKHGDRDAADALVRRYYRDIYAFSYRQTGDKEQAMDLTQEIFIAALKGILSYDEKKAGFRTWLYTIASNKIANFYRSKYHRQIALEVYGENPEELLGGYEQEESILQKMCDEQMVGRVMQVIVTYGNEWVRIFQLKLFLDKTFGEIAEELKLSENTVKTRYYTMLKRLRKEVRKWESRNGDV